MSYQIAILVLLFIFSHCSKEKSSYLDKRTKDNITKDNITRGASKAQLITTIIAQEKKLNIPSGRIRYRSVIRIDASITDSIKYDGGLVFSTSGGKIIEFRDGKLRTLIDRGSNKIIFSSDRRDNMLAWTEGENARSSLILERGGKLKVLFESEQKLYKLRFIGADKLLIALLTSEVILFSISEDRVIYRRQLSRSAFSDFALSEDRQRAVLANESGRYIIFNTGDGEVIETIKGLHKDRILSIAMGGHYIISGGQDRRLVIYDINLGSAEYIDLGFIVNKVAIRGDIIAFPLNEGNDIAIHNLGDSGNKVLYRSKDSLINSLNFIDSGILVNTYESGYLSIYGIRSK